MKQKKFELKEEHIMLLNRMRVEWQNCEFGAPAIDPKRPYGNSDVIQNMIEIFGLETLKDGVYKFKIFNKEWLLKGEDGYNLYLEGANEESLIETLTKLNEETATALQIVLVTKSFKPGLYKRDDYGINWKLVK